MKKKRLESCINFVIIIQIISLVLFFGYPQKARADALTALSDTMSRLADSTPTPVNSDHTIRFTTPSGATDATDTIEITFPASFSVTSVDYSDIDLHWGGSDGLLNSATLLGTADATHWGAYFTGQVLSFDHATDGAFEDIPATNKVVVEVGLNAASGDQQIDNHATAATYIISIGGDFGDTGKIAIVILTDDQVQLTATVDPSITFSISDTTSAFGALSVGSVTNSSPDIILTVGTNAGVGYTVTVRDTGSGADPGLYNATASPPDIIGSTDVAYADGPTTLANGVEGYGLYVLSTTGSPTVAGRYNGGGGTKVGGLEIIDTTIISRITSMSANDTATIRHRAAIATFTAAGSYSDTLTYIATGNF